MKNCVICGKQSDFGFVCRKCQRIAWLNRQYLLAESEGDHERCEAIKEELFAYVDRL